MVPFIHSRQEKIRKGIKKFKADEKKNPQLGGTYLQILKYSNLLIFYENKTARNFWAEELAPNFW